MPRPSDYEPIAAYLSGIRPVSHGELALARERARRDPVFQEGVERLTGLLEDGFSPCRAVQGRLDELASCSVAALEVRFPTLAAHVESCPGCREALWAFKPHWWEEVEEVVREGFARRRKRLAAGLRVVVSETRALLELGIGPLAAVSQPVAITADDLGVPVGGSVWRLRDEENGVSVELTLSAREDQQEGVSLECRLEAAAELGGVARYELSRVGPKSAILAAGPLASLVDRPLLLGVGRHRLVVLAGEGGTLSWEIPLTIEEGASSIP